MSSGPHRHTQEGAGHYALVCGCFSLSGLAALVYQTAWMRQFALVFGTSELAVATVLAAYMAGLALGARAIAIWLPAKTANRACAITLIGACLNLTSTYSRTSQAQFVKNFRQVISRPG